MPLQGGQQPQQPSERVCKRTRSQCPSSQLRSPSSFNAVIVLGGPLKPFEKYLYMVVSLNYCSQNGGNLYRAPYYNGNPNIGPRIIGNLDQTHIGPFLKPLGKILDIPGAYPE